MISQSHLTGYLEDLNRGNQMDIQLKEQIVSKEWKWNACVKLLHFQSTIHPWIGRHLKIASSLRSSQWPFRLLDFGIRYPYRTMCHCDSDNNRPAYHRRLQCRKKQSL